MSLGLAACMPAAFAATASGNFTVSLTLTPKCEITGAIGNLNVSYTSWQGAASTGSTSFNMRCTMNLAYAVALDNSGSYTDPTTSLDYTLKLSANSGSPAVGDTYSMSGTGNGATPDTFYVHANLASGQTGTCNSLTACTATNSRTLTITY
jgi:hypothetical protein